MDANQLMEDQLQLQRRLETWETKKEQFEEQRRKDANTGGELVVKGYIENADFYSTDTVEGVRERYRWLGMAEYVRRSDNRYSGTINQEIFRENSEMLAREKDYEKPNLSEEDKEELKYRPAAEQKRERKKQEKIRKTENKISSEEYKKALSAYKKGKPAYIHPGFLESEWAEKNIFSKKKKIPGGLPKTNRELYRDAMNGDYSNMEALDPVLRNRLAFEYLENFTTIQSERDTPQSLVDGIFEREGVKGLLNPLLRLGLSLAAKMEKPEETFKKFGLTRKQCAEFDELLSKRVMEETITKQPTMTEMKRLYNTDNPDEATMNAIQESVERNINSQVFTAKLLFLAHLGSMQKKEKKDGRITSGDWDLNVSTAFAHCSRVGIVLPGKAGDEFSKSEQSRMISSFTGAGEGLEAGFFKRGGATHDLVRKSKKIGGRKFKEKKTPLGTFSNQFGMNVAVGGLGADGIGGSPNVNRQLNNDGSCGHIYMHKQQGDADSFTSLLVGFESDSYKKTNQLGHTHGLGNGEYASSFGGQRIDEHGDKYGGRHIDLSHIKPAEFEKLMGEFDDFYRGLLMTPSEENLAILKTVSSKLTGKLMEGNEYHEFLKLFHK